MYARYKNLTFSLLPKVNAMTLYGFAGKNKQRFTNYSIIVTKLPFFKSFFKIFAKPVFDAYDFNGDGVISWKDFSNILGKFQRLYNWTLW